MLLQEAGGLRAVKVHQALTMYVMQGNEEEGERGGEGELRCCCCCFFFFFRGPLVAHVHGGTHFLADPA